MNTQIVTDSLSTCAHAADNTRQSVFGAVAAVIHANHTGFTGAEVIRELEGWDSLSVLDFMVAAEDTLGARLDPATLQECRVIDDLVRAVADAQVRA